MNNRLLRPTNNYDADALRYINAVQVADGQALEPEVRTAIDAFVRGCKSDSAGYAGDPTRTVWDALQAACIMCGARTISGALVPLVGDAPTAYSFASGDYSRTTGLKGDGSTKYLDSNQNANAFDDANYHHAIYLSDAMNLNSITLGYSTTGDTSYSQFFVASATVLQAYSLGNSANIGTASTTGLLGLSRSALASFNWVAGTASGTRTQTATQTLADFNYYVFARNTNGTVTNHSSTRASFYSIGSALDLAALDARVTALVTAIGAVI